MNNAQTTIANISTNVSTQVEAMFLPKGLTMLGYQQNHALQKDVPQKIEGYVFDRRFLREYRSWHNSPGERGFFIVGPTGCGKTTTIEAVNALINIPTLKVSCHPSMDVLDLKGQLIFKQIEGTPFPVSEYVYGPLARAFKYGYTLIMDENNLLQAGVNAGLNEVIRGDRLLIEQTGEVIHRHPMFRYIATGNDWGRGLGETRFGGLQEQNAAFLNRFWKFQVGYPTPEVEAQIIANRYPVLTKDISESMIKVANFIRPMICGVGDEGKATLEIDFSTRTLLDWVDTTLRFQGSENPLQYALEIVLLAMLSKNEKEIVERACQDIFGELYSKKVS